MKDISWNTALWNLSWEELYEGRYSEEGTCGFSSIHGATLVIPFGDLSETRSLELTGKFTSGIDPIRYDYLYGITQDGIWLVLLDALSKGVGCSIPGSTKETFRAHTVLASEEEFDPTASFISVRFEIELLRDWLGVKYEPEKKGNAYTFNFNAGSSSIPLHIGLDKCIEIRTGIDSPKSSKNAISIPYHCYIAIEYSKEKALEDIWHEDICMLRSVFAFCFGTYPDISSVKIRQQRNCNWINVYKTSVSTRQNAKLSPLPPIAFRHIGVGGIRRIVEGWAGLLDDEKHAAEMLTSLLGSWNMPIDLLLLTATTMLESLCRANRPPLYDNEQLKRICEPILVAVEHNLRQRVAGLLSMLARPSYNMILEEAYEKSKPWSEHLIPHWSKFKREQYTLRNGGAHGTSPDINYHIRIDHYHAQIILAYILLMKRLGLPSATINQFEKSNFYNSARWRIASNYAKP